MRYLGALIGFPPGLFAGTSDHMLPLSAPDAGAWASVKSAFSSSEDSRMRFRNGSSSCPAVARHSRIKQSRPVKSSSEASIMSSLAKSSQKVLRSSLSRTRNHAKSPHSTVLDDSLN